MRVGVVGQAGSAPGTLVFLVSIGPDLTFRLFFDGMLGDRRCAGGVGIKSSAVGPFYGKLAIQKSCVVNGVGAWSRDGEERRTRRKASTVGERVAMVVPPRTE